jgi:hypothetical protein
VSGCPSPGALQRMASAFSYSSCAVVYRPWSSRLSPWEAGDRPRAAVGHFPFRCRPTAFPPSSRSPGRRGRECRGAGGGARLTAQPDALPRAGHCVPAGGRLQGGGPARGWRQVCSPPLTTPRPARAPAAPTVGRSAPAPLDGPTGRRGRPARAGGAGRAVGGGGATVKPRTGWVVVGAVRSGQPRKTHQRRQGRGGCSLLAQADLTSSPESTAATWDLSPFG